MFRHGINKLADLVVVVVSCHQLRLNYMIGIEHYNSAVIVGAGRHDHGDAMVLSMNATLNMDECSPEVA
ncbi:hypothetical protein IG631_11977 [Alternaria alternata]|nr:hypothetical protein IG631_11977 [Alternaria alternata]